MGHAKFTSSYAITGTQREVFSGLWTLISYFPALMHVFIILKWRIEKKYKIWAHISYKALGFQHSACEASIRPLFSPLSLSLFLSFSFIPASCSSYLPPPCPPLMSFASCAAFSAVSLFLSFLWVLFIYSDLFLLLILFCNCACESITELLNMF